MTERGPVHVLGEVVATRRVGAHHHLTVRAPGVPERSRPGNVVAVSIGERTTRRVLWIHRVRASSAYGPTVEVVVAPRGDGSRWLADLPVGSRVEVTGPLGRPFALPTEPVACVLVGEEYAAAPLLPLAERLRERGASVSLLMAARDEAHLLSALEARRSVRSVTVVTTDGSVGLRGEVADHVTGVIERADASVVYATGRASTLAAVAAAAEIAGAWSQVAPEVPAPCGTGLCHGCPLPVLGEDGVARTVRSCTEGPVVRGDRVRWADL